MMCSNAKGAVLGFGFCIPASEADEFGATARMTTPSFQGACFIARNAKKRNTRSRITRQLLNTLVRSMFLLQVYAQDARILYPCVERIHNQTDDDNEHYLPNNWTVRQYECSHSRDKCGCKHGHAGFECAKRTIKNGALMTL